MLNFMVAKTSILKQSLEGQSQEKNIRDDTDDTRTHVKVI